MFSSLERYIIVFAFIVINITHAQQKIDLNTTLFDYSDYQIIKTYENKVLLIGKEDFIDVESQLIKKYDSSRIDSVFSTLTLPNLKWTSIGSKVYFVNPSGGYVFEFDGKGIKRIDNSSNLRAYYASKVFSYNNEIYQLGGYGFWQYRSQLLKFDFDTKQWVLERQLLDDNLGFIDPLVQVKQDKLFIICDELADNFFGTRLKNEHIYIYDFLSKKTEKKSFDYNSFSGYFKENRFFLFKHSNSTGNLSVINYLNNFQVGVFDFFSNKMSVETIYDAIDPESGFVKKDSVLYCLTSYKLNNEKIFLAKTKVIDVQYQGKVFKSYYPYYLLALMVFPALFYYFRKEKRFLLEGKELKKGRVSIRLDYDESYFLKTLAAEYQVENQTLISYFNRDNKSYDLNVKRKNKMISNLASKISTTFKTELFSKEPSSKDKRQSVYLLKKKLKLVK